MSESIRHWYAIFKIYVQEGFAYRVSGLVWILIDAVTAITMPLVMIASLSASGNISGYNAQDFVLYYICLVLIGNFVTCHFMWDFAMEIKEGQFTTFLLKPVSYFQFMFVRNLAWRIVRSGLFIPIFVLLLIGYRQYLHSAEVYANGIFWISLILGHLVSFTFVMAMCTIAFFVQEATAIFNLYYIPMMLLSGRIVPIQILPGWLHSFSYFTPFYFTTGVPTEILIGRLSGEQAWNLVALQLVWLIVSYVLFRIFWKIGLKHYTGVGM